MLELGPTVCVLFGALLFLGRADRRYWPSTPADESLRRLLRGAGLLSLLAALAGFGRYYGLEVGVAWFLLWLTSAALVATVWLSVRPRSSAWAGGLFWVTAFGLWML
ncbi:MAG: DUF3325 family protein [Acidobacteriota bacterium]